MKNIKKVVRHILILVIGFPVFTYCAEMLLGELYISTSILMFLATISLFYFIGKGIDNDEEIL